MFFDKEHNQKLLNIQAIIFILCILLISFFIYFDIFLRYREISSILNLDVESVIHRLLEEEDDVFYVAGISFHIPDIMYFNRIVNYIFPVEVENIFLGFHVINIYYFRSILDNLFPIRVRRTRTLRHNLYENYIEKNIIFSINSLIHVPSSALPLPIIT